MTTWTKDHADYLEVLIKRAISTENTTDEEVIRDVQRLVRGALIGLRRPIDSAARPCPLMGRRNVVEPIDSYTSIEWGPNGLPVRAYSTRGDLDRAEDDVSQWLGEPYAFGEWRGTGSGDGYREEFSCPIVGPAAEVYNDG